MHSKDLRIYDIVTYLPTQHVTSYEKLWLDMITMQAFPSISRQEFNAACVALELMSGDRLNGTSWLGVRWTGEELLITERRTTARLQHEAAQEQKMVEEPDLVEDVIEGEIVRSKT